MALDTLVLDPTGKPVAVSSWQDVMTLYAKERIDIIESDANHPLRSQSLTVHMPVVAQLRHNFERKIRREVAFSKNNVAIRDRDMCQYCGRKLTKGERTFDHVMPQSRGGKSSWKNLVLSCGKCNSRKADKTPEEAGMYLLNKPVKPSPQDPRFEFKLRVYKVKPQWKPWSSWLTTSKSETKYD